MDEINQNEDFDTRMEIFLRGQTCPRRLPNKSGKTYWNPVRRPDISGDQNRTVQFTKPNTPVLTRQRIVEELWEKLEKLREI
jgi:hypothetical protein